MEAATLFDYSKMIKHNFHTSNFGLERHENYFSIARDEAWKMILHLKCSLSLSRKNWLINPII